MAVTMKDIALTCHVSRGTVDRALNGRGGINDETRQLVLETAERLGYKRHYIASSLKTGKTNAIGIIVFDLYNQYFADIINTVEEYARFHGYSVYLSLTNKDPKVEEKCVAQLLERQVDGIILASVNKDSSYISKLISLTTPVISIGNKIHKNIPHYDLDNHKAMYDATKYVMDKGYEELIYVSPPLKYEKESNVTASLQRLQGFLDCCEDYQVKTPIFIRDGNYIDYAKELIRQVRKPAFICSSDLFALEILKTFQGEYEPGKDFGIMGFDNINILDYIVPRLCTVDYPIDDIAEAIILDLINYMNNNEPLKSLAVFDHSIISGHTL